MISVQSHAKQIKLLNDYIAALEKQISSSRKQNQLLQNSSTNSGEEQKRMMEDLGKLRNENGQIKFQNYKQQEQLRRLAGLEQEYFAVRQQIDREIQVKNQLAQENQKLMEALKKEQDQAKAIFEDFNKKKQVWEVDSSKHKLEIEELRKIQMAKDKKYTQLTLMLSQEKKNSTTKQGIMQAENSMMIQNKNDSIVKLTKEIDDLKNNLSSTIAQRDKDAGESREHIAFLQNQVNQTHQKLQNLQADIEEMELAINMRNKEISDLKTNLQSKTQEFNVLLKKTNEEKRSLLQAINKLGEEKKKNQERTSEEKRNLQQAIDKLVQEKKKVEEKIKQCELTINVKNKEINTFKANLKNKTQECDALFKKTNEEKRSLLVAINKLGDEKKKTQEKIKEIELVINLKNREIIQCKDSLKAKAQEFNLFVKETSQEKRNLEQTIDRLGEERKNLQVINNACKGNISENSKALTDTLKQKEEVTLKLSATNSLLQKTEKELEQASNQLLKLTQLIKERDIFIESLKTTALSREKTISDLSEQLENTENARTKTVREGEELTKKLNALHHQNQLQRQQFIKLTQQSQSKILNLNNQLQNLQKAKNQQSKKLNKIINDLEYERDSKNMDLSETGQRIVQFNHRMSDLHQEKKLVQQHLQAITQEFGGYKKKKQAETQDLTAKLKQSQKKIQKSKLKIDELSREIKELQSHHQNKAQNITLTQQEQIQRIKVKMNKTMAQIKNQSQQKINKTNHQIQQLRKQLIKLTDEHFKSLKSKEEEYSVKEKNLQSSLRNLTLQNQSLQDQIKKGNISVVLEKQSKSTKQFQFQSQREKITLLQNTTKEQKKSIEELNKLISDKHKEYQILEQSNAMLRKQVINVITREQTSRKQLLQIKSTVGSVYLSRSRVNLTQEDIEDVSIYKNAAAKKRRTNGTLNTLNRVDYPPNAQKRSMSRKKQAPINLATSLVEEVRTYNDNFENKVTD